MIDRIFNIVFSFFIAVIVSIISFIPSLYISMIFFGHSQKAAKHPVMPIGYSLAAFAVSAIVFIIGFYKSYKNHQQIILWLKVKLGNLS